MKRSVQDAIKNTREAVVASRKWRMCLSGAWSQAEVLADEVERVHAELERVKLANARLAEQVADLTGAA